MGALQCVTFYLLDMLYSIGVQDVQEVLPSRTTTRVPLAGAEVAGLVNLRGQVVLAVDLRARLGLAPAETDQALVVVTVGGEQIALLVDRIGDIVEVQPAQFEPPPPTLPRQLREVISGAFKLDGQLLLAIDVDVAVAA